MKKIRILCLTLVAAMMLIGAGYAQWTDQVVINNVVQTGELNVKFTQGTFSELKYPDACAAQYANASAQIDEKDDHTMQVQLNGLYPGSWAAFRVKGINAGTIPAKLDNVDVQFSGDEELLPYLTYETYITIDKDGDSKNLTTFNLHGQLGNLKDDFNNYLKSHNYIKDMQLAPGSGCFYIGAKQNGSDNNNSCCNPGDNIPDGYIIIKFDKTAPNELQTKSLTFTFTINFKQYNQ